MHGPMARTGACRLCGNGLDPRRGAGRRSYCEGCAAKADKKAAQRPRVDCKECGKAFSTMTRTVRYCSDACRAAAARRSNNENQRRYAADPKNRAIKLARARVSAAARRARDRAGGVVVVGGGGENPPPPPTLPLPPPPRRATRDAEGPGRNATAAEPYACALCGRSFAPYGSGARPVHCKRCRAKADKEIGKKLAVNCKECGKKFSTPNRIVKYCSTKCRAAGRSRISRESSRRRMADPEARALVAARWRAWDAARRGGKKGRSA